MSYDGWKETKIVDITTNVTMGPFGSNIKSENFVSYGIPVIRGINLSAGRFYNKGFVFLTDEKADELKSSNAFPDDIIFTHRGTLGQVGIVPPNIENSGYSRYVVSQSQMKLTCDLTKAYPLFIYYYFKSPFGQHALLANTSTTGVPAIARPVSSLKSIVINLPELSEQKAIASTLSVLDDKIELNNQISKKLEEMAQAVFKSWFVDFEPFKDGEFVESELGLMPKGWCVRTFGDVCEKIFSGGTPSTSNERFWNGKHCWLSSGETRNRYIVTTEKSITGEGVQNSSTRLAQKYDVVIASAGQGHTRGQTSLCLIDTYINQSVVSLRADREIMHPSYLYFNLSNRYEELRLISDSSSIRGSLTTKTLQSLKIVIPPMVIQNRVIPIFEQIIANIEYHIKQTWILTEIRDLLLPKLMSGEIKLPLVEG